MTFRFTLTNESGSIEINEPDGWEDAVLKLARDKDFHSLIEFFDGSFIFYGDNGVVNGGLHWIKDIEQIQGVDATIEIVIEYAPDSEYIEIFSGQLDLSLAEEMPNNKMRIPIIRDDFWSNFYSRKDTPVDLQAVRDLDDEDITPVDIINMTLTGQKVQQKHESHLTRDAGFVGLSGIQIGSPGVDDDTNDFVQFDWNQEDLREIEEKFSLPIASNPDLPVNILKVKYGGSYTFDIRIDISDNGGGAAQSVDAYLDIYFRHNSDNTAFTKTSLIFIPSVNVAVSYTFQGTVDLVAGDEITIYGQRSNDRSFVILYQQSFTDFSITVDAMNFFNVTAQTIYPDSEAQAFLIHDAAAAILKSYGLGVDNPFYSDIFGSEVTNARQYVSDGCEWKYSLQKGLQLRGYTLDEKPFFMSFMQWWKGAYPIFNLGLTYETLNAQVSGGGDSELLQNTEFNDSSIWTQEDSGVDWVVGGGTADISIVTSDSKRLTQVFTGTAAGDYEYTHRRVSTNFNIGTDSLNLAVTFYDDTDTVIGSATYIEFVSGNNDVIATHNFTTTVPVRKVDIIASWNSGADMDLSFLYASLTGPLDPTIIPESPIIRVEQLSEFFQDEIFVNISNIQDITRKYDTDFLHNKIEIGYESWQAEEISGLDDPQTKKTYATRFKKIGKSITLYSEYIAASLAIEQTRRQTIQKSKDYKFDNNTFIIALNDDVSPDNFIPELDENFASVLNLLNPETRYNIKLSVARNFLRFRSWFNGQLQSYLDSFYKFVGAEGNSDMISEMDINNCLDEDFGGDELSEKQDIPVTNEFIHSAYYYEINCPLEFEDYETIRNNRKNAIGISLTDTNHIPFFIDQLDYKLVKGTCHILGWSKEYIDLTVIESPAATQDCFPSTECENPITDQLGEILTDENGVCITE